MTGAGEGATGACLGKLGILLGFYRDNEKEHGNYYSTIGYILGLDVIMSPLYVGATGMGGSSMMMSIRSRWRSFRTREPSPI